MNILVIGNGFDLAHELPTNYIDFLKWTVGQYNFFYTLKEQDAQITKPIQDISLKIPEKVRGIGISQRVEHQKEIWNCIDNNVWIEYFLPIYSDREKKGKDGWIDFECEISEVIQSLDNDMHGLSQVCNIEDIVDDLSNDFLKEMYSDYIDAVQPINPTDNGLSDGISFKEIRDKLFNDLNRLIRAFEIYLTEYVEQIDVKVVSPDIEKIATILYENRGQKGVLLSKVISFNYTNIYEQIYLSKHNIDNNDYVDYIHGKADSNNTVETNNMVLGIDEYLGKKERNKQIEFIAFKKFYQRIHKQTGCKYKEWVDKIKEDYKNKLNKDTEEYPAHNLYIFGHSLDVTDKDVLRDLILNDNVHTTIFYHNKNAMGQQIANLVKVIGQKELIRRTGGSTKTIEFKPQREMLPINNQ